MGWKINVLDACDKEQPTGPEPGASTSEDLQSRGSIQYATRVKPENVESKQFYHDGPIKNAVSKDGVMPPVPVELEENLRQDFYKPLAAQTEPFTRYDNGRLPAAPPVASQQNFTLYAYPSWTTNDNNNNNNYTYGNVPFYVPNDVHYGGPRPVKSSAHNYALPPSYNNNNNNNYRPIRQPAIAAHFHAIQPNVSPDPYRPAVQTHAGFAQHKPIKHVNYRVSGKRLPSNGGARQPANGAHHYSVVYKKPVYIKSTVRPVPSAHYHDPTQPVPVHPGHFPHPQQHSVPQNNQQHRPLLRSSSDSTQSVSQSVSVTYSSSAKRPRPVQTAAAPGRAPIQNGHETVAGGRHHKPQGGFNHNTVVVEGGFKPIVPGAGADGSADGESEGFDGTAATTVSRHNNNEKKMNKKLISRKPVDKRADGSTESSKGQPLRALQETATTTTATGAGENAMMGNAATTAESKQTAGNSVVAV